MEFMKRFNPHVVISDQRMPEMTGVEFLRQVKDVAPHTVQHPADRLFGSGVHRRVNQ